MAALWILLLACVAVALLLLLHVLVRTLFRRPRVVDLYFVAAIALTLTLIGAAILWPAHRIELPAVAAVAGCCFLAYVHWYVAMFRSLSVRILEEMRAAGGALTLDELDARYPLRWMFTSRLEGLEASGWIMRREGAYVCTAKGRRVARIIQRLRKLYGIRQAG